MKIILSNYTDLGNPSTPKGLESEWVGYYLSKKGLLSKVLCRGVAKKRMFPLKKKYIYTPIPFGRLLPLAMSGIKKYVYKNFKSRYFSHLLYDYFASKLIDDADVLCCQIPSMRKQMKAARKKGMKVFVFATSAHIDFTRKFMKEEYNKFGLVYNDPALKFANENRKSYVEADFIFARSEFNKRTLIENGIPDEKIHSKPINVYADIKKFKPGIKKDDTFRATYVGQVSFAKGVHYLLEAWDKADLKNAELVICGGIDPIFKKTFNKYFNNPTIRFLGHADPLKHLQQSNIFCFPSLSEGCPQAVVEAMACGLPVIATENSGSVARHGKEGFIVPVRSSKAFVKYIKYFYDNPSRINEMGRKGIKRANNFSIQNYAKKVAGYLEDAYSNIT